MCKVCAICGSSYLVEEHHIVFRSQNKQLIKCESNKIYFCYNHHRGTFGVHGSKGHNLDKKLKLEFQNELEILWDKQYLTREDIQQVLQISEKALDKLLKTLQLDKDKYVREDVLRAVMGGRMIIE